MAEVIYRFQELTSGVVIEDLPVSCSSGLPRALNADADTTFSLPLGDVDIQKLDFKSATTPGRMAVFCVEDGEPIWGGMVWARQFQKSTRVLTITTATIESYWRSRVMRSPINVAGMDQYAILVYLLSGVLPVGGGWKTLERDGTMTQRSLYHQEWIQDYDGVYVPVADCIASIELPITNADGTSGFWWSVTNLSGVLRDRSWSPGKVVYDAVSELCAIHGGIEWTANPAILSNGALGWVVDMGNPRLGRTYDKTGLDWSSTVGWNSDNQQADPDDNIEDYTYSEDARKSANHQVDVGADVNGVPLVSDIADLSSIRQGYPVLEQSSSWSDVVYQSTLDLHSSGDLSANALPIAASTWSINADSDPQFGSYQLGDEALFRVSDSLDPQQPDGSPGRMTIERIVGWTYFPEQAGQRRRVDLITNPTSQLRTRMPPSLKKRMESLQAQLDGIATTGSNISSFSVPIGNSAQVAIAGAGGGGTTDLQVLGDETLVSSLTFYRQADFLTVWVTAWLGGSADPAAANTLMGLMLVDGEDDSLLTGDLSVPYPRWTPVNDMTPYQWWTYIQASYGSSSAYAASLRLPLNKWEYGELVNLQLLAQVVDMTGSATVTPRYCRVFSAFQGK